MRRWLGEPLLHFLLLGAAIFAAFAAFGPAERPQASIVVTRGIIDGQVAAFARTWLRPPTPQEVDELIREYVRDEVYYREGMALGLDRDDTVIRRRLRQKLEFVAEAEGMAVEPTDAVLQAHLDEHQDAYRVDARVSFEHVYVSTDRRGDRAVADATRLLAELRAARGTADTTALGDPTMLAPHFDDAPLRDVAAQFGDGFAARLETVPVGEWQGPVESGYGLHVVLVSARTDGRVPPLDEVRDAVRRDWLNEQRIAANERYYQGLLQRYTVTTEGSEVAATAGGSGGEARP